MGNLIYLFDGENLYSKRQKINLLKKSFLKEYNEFNYNLFYAEEALPKDIISLAKTIPFFDNKRLIIVKNFEKYTLKQKLAFGEYLDNPLDITMLIFEANEKLSKKEKWHEIFANNATLETFYPYTDKMLNKIIVDFFKRHNKILSSEAVNSLVSLFKDNQKFLEEELKKLLLFVYNKDNIEKIDIDQIIFKADENDIYKFSAVLSSLDYKKSFEILENLSPNVIKESTIIFYTIFNRFVKILEYLTMKKEKKSSFEINAMFRKQNFYPDKNFYTDANNFNFEKIYKILDLLIETDSKVKTGKLSIDTKFLLEKLIIEIKFLME